LIALILIVPLLFQQYSSSKEQLHLVVNWSSVLGVANLKNLILIPLKFSFGRISFYPKIIYYILAGFWSLLVFVFSFKGFIRIPKLLFLFTVPLILAFIFSLISPLFQYFRFLYLLPILSLGLALGIRHLSVKSIFLSIFIFLSFLYLLNPAFHREDWQSLSRLLPSDSAVYMIASFSDPVKYYRPDVRIFDIRNLNNSPQSFYVIPYGESIHGFDHTTVLSVAGYQLDHLFPFNQIDLEFWRH